MYSEIDENDLEMVAAQKREHALAEFYKEANLLINDGFISGITPKSFFKQIDALWQIKHSFKYLLKRDIDRQLQAIKEKIGTPPTPTSNEVAIIFISIAKGMLAHEFAEAEQKEDFKDLLKVLLRIKNGLVKHTKRVSKLKLLIGAREGRGKHPALEQVIEKLESMLPYQEFAGEDGVVLARPTVIPNVYLYQTKMHNGSAINYRKLFYLAGVDTLYKKAQTSFIND